ncbi:MAG: hypothetical protein LBI17_01125 [Rickettsiales bacterium]|jgi:hypothetical protein|nr:hypothetical protein [Rickettsiales bacterium]
MRKNLNKDKAFAKDLTEFFDDMAREFVSIADDKERSRGMAKLKKAYQSFSDGNLEGLAQNLDTLKKYSAIIDSKPVDEYAKFSDFASGTDISFSQYLGAEQSKSFTARLDGIIGRIEAARNRTKPFMGKLLDIAENIDFESIDGNIGVALIIVISVMSITCIWTYGEHEAYVNRITPKSIVLDNGETIGNREELPFEIGDYVLYTDSVPGYTDIKGGRLYNRSSGADPVDFGRIRTEKSPHGLEKDILHDLSLREQMVLLAAEPNAVAEVAETFEDNTLEAKKEALTVLRRRIWELERQR